MKTLFLYYFLYNIIEIIYSPVESNMIIYSIFKILILMHNLTKGQTCSTDKMSNCASSNSKLFKMNNYNDVISLNNSFILFSFDCIIKMKCIASCSSNNKCTHLILKNNKCFICNENVIGFLSKNTTDSLIYQKKMFIKAAGLINYWPFYTNFTDIIGNISLYGGLNAYLTSDRSNRIGSALSLLNGYLNLQSGFYFIGQQFTLLLWIRVRNYNTWSKVIEVGNGASTDGSVMFFISGDSSTPQIKCLDNGNVYADVRSSQMLTLNTWEHLAFVYSYPSAFIFINGASTVTSYTIQPSKIATNISKNVNYVGKGTYGFDRNADADFDEIKIFNRALTRNEILFEMNNELIID
jgi:hypothetical protein